MLQYIQPITLDVAGGNVYKYVYAKQGDSGSRYVCATILANGKAIDISDDLTAEFRAVKRDGKSVINPATINNDGTITVELTQQTLAVEGTVDADIIIKNSSGDVLSTASFKILVEKAPVGEQIDSANEILGAEELIAEAVEAYMAENPVEAGSSVYIGAVQPADGTLYWLDTSDSGGVAEEYSITANLANVSIDNAATSITEGDSYAATLTADEGYTLSTVMVTMGGANVTNTVYASGSIYIASVTGDIIVTAAATEIPAATPVYAITNNLLHATSDNAAVSAEENTAYTATLTADTDYTLDGATVTVTMGGTDVTAEVYADGVINIPAVTGDVVITVVAAEPLGEFAISKAKIDNGTSYFKPTWELDGETLVVTYTGGTWIYMRVYLTPWLEVGKTYEISWTNERAVGDDGNSYVNNILDDGSDTRIAGGVSEIKFTVNQGGVWYLRLLVAEGAYDSGTALRFSNFVLEEVSE